MAIGNLNINISNRANVESIKEALGNSDDNTTVMNKLDSLMNKSGGGMSCIHSHLYGNKTSIIPVVDPVKIYMIGSGTVTNMETGTTVSTTSETVNSSTIVSCEIEDMGVYKISTSNPFIIEY